MFKKKKKIKITIYGEIKELRDKSENFVMGFLMERMNPKEFRASLKVPWMRLKEFYPDSKYSLKMEENKAYLQYSITKKCPFYLTPKIPTSVLSTFKQCRVGDLEDLTIKFE